MAGLTGQHWLTPDWDPRLTIAQLSLPHLTAHGLRAAECGPRPRTLRKLSRLDLGTLLGPRPGRGLCLGPKDRAG